MLLNIFIAVIILLIVLITVIWYMSNKNEKNLIEAQERVDLIKLNKTQKLIDDLKDVQQTGASLRSYEKQKQTYQNIADEIIPSINEDIKLIQENNSSFKIISSHNKIKKQFQIIDNVKAQLNETNTNLASLAESTKINASQNDSLQNKYQKIRKQLLTKSFVYGPAASSLEAELVEVEQLFDKEKALTESGDHLEAKNLLEDIKKKTDIIDYQMKKTEPLYQDLIDTFPGQIEEIEHVYNKMKAQKFAFNEPGIEDGVMQVTNAIGSAKEKLGVFDFSSVEIDNKAIAIEIDQLYDLLESESNAKIKVTKQSNPVFEFLQHAQRQNEVLVTDLEKVDRNYVLLNDELDTARNFKKQIFNLSENYEDIAEKISKSSVIYSKVLSEYEKITSELTKIEEKQRQIHNDVQEMFDGERVARVSIKTFRNDMKKQKNIVDQMRLRGLPKSYLDYFKMVATEIDRLQDKLSQDKINIDDISKQLIIVQEDLNNLDQKTKELIYDVRISERAIQYANRYINNDENINAASIEARRLYDQRFEYNEAFKTIATALEVIEPGSIERLKASMDD
ncbi:septation ring formation regulator EzrA [Companilactobacillus sp. RD055328]|uniref:septation ring formation regulator EzrA n=1 Tax=Companilactobacillus sp. RD055328 TaxID=2916634 RepID=UPI001FC80177|nr:septation ring formation regulator EzrA [Companilactobacillus sp. RD055328]GKQ42865.1 septation ring formation regulator EzrA [Companilactobacillus sp. RD055328]